MSWGHHWVWVVPLMVIGVHMVMQSRTALSRLVSVAAVLALLLSTFVWRSYRGFPVTQIDRILPLRERGTRGGRDRVVIDVSSDDLADGFLRGHPSHRRNSPPRHA